MKLFHFFVIFASVIIQASSIEIKEPVSFIETLPSMQIDYSSKSMKTTLCFGSNKQCLSMVINPSTYYTWVTDSNNSHKNINKFDSSRSQTCKVYDVEEIFLASKKLRGNAIEDALSINNFSVLKFNFLSVLESDDSLKEVEGMLGLGFLPNPEDRKFSFLSQLEDKRFIQSAVFVIDLMGNGGLLTLGRVPVDILRDYKNYGNCKIDASAKMQRDSAWICNLRSMTFGQEYNPNGALNFGNALVKFDISSEKTIVPIKYLLQLEKIYFEKAIESGDCNFGIKNGYYTYTCLTQDLQSFQEISLSFENWAIHIPLTQLFTFDQTDNEYEFIIYNKDGLDEFVIGMNIMKHYRMVFDERNSLIGFYNENNRLVFYIGDTPLSPPFIPEDNGLQPPNPNDKDRPLQPPVKDPVDAKPVPIPDQKSSFFQKFFMFIGMLSLITGILFISWLGFRFYRRKKYNDPSFYYKATDEFFQDGSRIE